MPYPFLSCLQSSGWIYFLIDKKTKKIVATCAQPDHCCMGYGGDPVKVPHPFIDYKANSSINYYRLKQLDFDGKYSYSNIISANCSTNSESDDIFIHNSPYSDEISITLNGNLQTTYYLSFIDQTGRTLIQEQISFYPENQKFTINKSGLSAGIYNVVLRSKDNVITKQVVICR